METKIQFKKYSGNGNDFVVLDHPNYPVTENLVKNLCNRHFGIGADGVLVLTSEDGFDGRMRILNADGSEAEMCGKWHSLSCHFPG